jgi:hypothetical protein
MFSLYTKLKKMQPPQAAVADKSVKSKNLNLSRHAPTRNHCARFSQLAFENPFTIHTRRREKCALAEHKLLIHATMTNSTWKMACPVRLSVHTMSALKISRGMHSLMLHIHGNARRRSTHM